VGRACADPGYYVVTPYDNAGLLTADLRYWTTKPKGRVETYWPELALGLGVNSRWTTELYLSWLGTTQRAARLSTLNWRNEIMLTQGEWPLDIGLHLQWTREHLGRRDQSIEFGPTMQTDFGRWRVNANVFFERGLDGASAAVTQMKLQWQINYRHGPVLAFGVQGFGELGAWDDSSPKAAQSHRAGPTISGHWMQGERASFKLQGAWLWGKTYNRAGHMFSLNAHSEF
jgi:hypothetical protein